MVMIDNWSLRLFESCRKGEGIDKMKKNDKAQGRRRIIVTSLLSLSSSLLLLFLLLGVASALVEKHGDENDAANTNKDNNISSAVLLRDGVSIPMMGLGLALTAQASYDAVQWALAAGYRLLDTAAEETYGNERQVGQAVRDYVDNNNITRSDIFVTTKLWDDAHGFWETLQAFDESYLALDVGTIDLYLIHSPFGGKLIETWDALLYLQSKGYVKSIGVSNFGIPHLQILLEHGRPLPVVNQIELHPLNYKQRSPLIEWCRQHQVRIQAYGSLMHGYEEWLSTPDLLTDMAARYENKKTSHILLKWALQRDFLIIPKSGNQQRIVDNSLLYDFELSDTDMARLDSWGHQVPLAERNLYKQDWNWNPVDEAPVHGGRVDYWPNYTGVDEIYYSDDELEVEQEKGSNTDEL